MSSDADAPPPTAEPAAPAAPAAPEAAPGEPAPSFPGDDVRHQMLATLQERLGDAVVGSEIAHGDLWVRVRSDAWRSAAEVCKSALDCDYFVFVSGLDWLPNPDLGGEKVWDPEAAAAQPASGNGQPAEPQIETGVAGGDTRFQVFARLYSTRSKVGITLKADLDTDDPRVESWSALYRGADWHERETWEMYGFQFDGHTGLRHMYLPAEFEGFPLRKDFPLLAREVKPWPGLVDVEPLPGEDETADASGEDGAGEEAADASGEEG